MGSQIFPGDHPGGSLLGPTLSEHGSGGGTTSAGSEVGMWCESVKQHPAPLMEGVSPELDTQPECDLRDPRG